MGIRDWFNKIFKRNKELPEGRGEEYNTKGINGHAQFQAEMQGMAKLSPEEIQAKKQEQDRTDDLQFAYRNVVQKARINIYDFQEFFMSAKREMAYEPTMALDELDVAILKDMGNRMQYYRKNQIPNNPLEEYMNKGPEYVKQAVEEVRGQAIKEASAFGYTKEAAPNYVPATDIVIRNLIEREKEEHQQEN